MKSLSYALIVAFTGFSIAAAAASTPPQTPRSKEDAATRAAAKIFFIDPLLNRPCSLLNEGEAASLLGVPVKKVLEIGNAPEGTGKCEWSVADAGAPRLLRLVVTRLMPGDTTPVQSGLFRTSHGMRLRAKGWTMAYQGEDCVYVTPPSKTAWAGVAGVHCAGSSTILAYDVFLSATSVKNLLHADIMRKLLHQARAGEGAR
jgi:hypothetical protein